VFTIMMRWLLLAVLVVALTVGATLALQFLPADDAPDKGRRFPSSPIAEKDRKDAPPGIAEVDGGLIHDFGVMSQYSKGEKTWVIKNVGKGDLRLIKGKSSCSCTIASLKDGDMATIKPGEQTTVLLEWDTKDNNGKFGQTAEILTPDDPNRQMIEFIVRGHVAPAIVMVPPGNTVQFSSISNNESHRAYFGIYSPDKPDMEITSITTSRPEHLQVSYKPFTDEEREQLQISTKGGYRVEVEVMPGMPLGDFREEVVLETTHSKQPMVRMAVIGKTVGPITVVPDHVMFSATSSDQSASAAVTLIVRDHDQTKFEISESPQNLKAEISEVDDSAKADRHGSKARVYRMTVTVPPGTSPAVIAGTIILKTNHPLAGEVRIPVNVTVFPAG
jgi:Protein of unknown function (DUF1573)